MADNRDAQQSGQKPVDQSDLDATDDRSAVRQPAQGSDLGDQGNTGTTSTERSTTNKAQNVRS